MQKTEILKSNLQYLKKEISIWRSQKKFTAEKLPDKLISKVVSISKEVPISTIINVIKLDRGTIKKYIKASQQIQKTKLNKTTQKFLEVKSFMPNIPITTNELILKKGLKEIIIKSPITKEILSETLNWMDKV